MHGNTSDQSTLTLCRTARGQVRVVHPCDDPQGVIRSGDGPLGYDPVQHLAIALGCCTTEIARRFLERRQHPTTMVATLDWEVDGRNCRIARMDLTLGCVPALSDDEHHVLGRMMNQCPIHQAIHGNVPVHVRYRQLDADEARLGE